MTRVEQDAYDQGFREALETRSTVATDTCDQIVHNLHRSILWCECVAAIFAASTLVLGLLLMSRR